VSFYLDETMAKRSRRVRKQQVEKQIEQPTPKAPVTETPVEKVAAPAPSATMSAAAKSVDFASEYDYVYNDLRTVTVFAVLMFVLMAVLGYFI
jgi:hypothetical protein